MNKFLLIFILTCVSCKPSAKRSFMEKKRHYNGLALKSSISGETSTMRVLSSDMHLTSSQNKSYDVDLKVSLTLINEKSLRIDIAKLDNHDLIVSDTIPRYKDKPLVNSSTGEFQWFLYRKEKILDKRNPKVEYTISVMVLSDYSGYTLRIDSVEGERMKTVEGTAFVTKSSD